MEAKELRIGNLILLEGYDEDAGGNIYHDPEGDEVLTVSYDVLGNFDGGGPSRYAPIPLTEEWLIKFGFEKSGYDYWNGPVYFELAGNKDGTFIHSINCHEYDDGIPIKHVHQLQNLYFALTGEELIIK